jgi:guanine deaminase
MTDTDMNIFFMSRAIELSRNNMLSDAGGPFGAVIVKDGKIVGEGWNKVTSQNDPTAHAEVEAIRDACRRLGTFELRGCVLYTSCEPCPMCLAATYWSRIDRIYFGNTRSDAAAAGFDDEFLYREIATPMDARSVPIKPLLRDQAILVFHEWNAKQDKIPY